MKRVLWCVCEHVLAEHSLKHPVRTRIEMPTTVSFEGDDVIIVAWVTVAQIIDEDRIVVRDHADNSLVVKLPRTARIGDRLRLKGQGRSVTPAGPGNVYVLLKNARRLSPADPTILGDSPVVIDPEIATCSYCKHRLVAAKLMVCPHCLTPTHLECWKENGRKCPVFGCAP